MEDGRIWDRFPSLASLVMALQVPGSMMERTGSLFAFAAGAAIVPSMAVVARAVTDSFFRERIGS